jgi:hypothetical protein
LVAAIVVFLWGPRTFTRYRFAWSSQERRRVRRRRWACACDGSA